MEEGDEELGVPVDAVGGVGREEAVGFMRGYDDRVRIRACAWLSAVLKSSVRDARAVSP